MEAKDEIKKIVDFVMDLDMLTGIDTDEREHIETAVIEGYKAGIKLVVQLWIKRCPECGSYIPKNLNETRTLKCRECGWDGEAQLKEWGIEDLWQAFKERLEK